MDLSPGAHRRGAAARGSRRSVRRSAAGSWSSPRSTPTIREYVTPARCGRLRVDAHWSDDFHHAVHVALTGERGGLLRRFRLGRGQGSRERYVDDGRYRPPAAATRRPAADVPAERFVVAIQNHDQIGNRARGERLSALIDPGSLRLGGRDTVCSRPTCRCSSWERSMARPTLPVLREPRRSRADRGGAGGPAAGVRGLRVGRRGARSAGGGRPSRPPARSGRARSGEGAHGSISRCTGSCSASGGPSRRCGPGAARWRSATTMPQDGWVSLARDSGGRRLLALFNFARASRVLRRRGHGAPRCCPPTIRRTAAAGGARLEGGRAAAARPLRRAARSGGQMTRVWPGAPAPLGATWDGEGTNFAIFSEHATGVELCLFENPESARGVGAHQAAGADRPDLARLPAGRASGTALRLPGARALRAGSRATASTPRSSSSIPTPRRSTGRSAGATRSRATPCRRPEAERDLVPGTQRQRGRAAEVRRGRVRVQLGRRQAPRARPGTAPSSTSAT